MDSEQEAQGNEQRQAEDGVRPVFHAIPFTCPPRWTSGGMLGSV